MFSPLRGVALLRSYSAGLADKQIQNVSAASYYWERCEIVLWLSDYVGSMYLTHGYVACDISFMRYVAICRILRHIAALLGTTSKYREMGPSTHC